MEGISPKSQDHRRMTKAELADRLLALQQAPEENKPLALREREFQTVLHELEVYQIELEMQVRELRDSRQALEDSHERYVNLYDFAPVGYITLNDQGMIQEINLTAASIFGVERHWLLNRSLAPWVLGADLPDYRQHLKKCRESEGKVLTSLHLVGREKQVVPVELSSVRTVDSQSGQAAIRTALTDLTDRKVYQENLDFERHKLGTIFYDSPAAMALLRGSDLVFEKVNPKYQALFADRDLVGRPLLEAIPELEGQPFPELLQNVLKTGETFRGHEVPAQLSRVVGGSREERFFDFSYVQIQNQERRPYGVYIHAVDVTERVLTRRTLEEGKAEILRKVSELETERGLRERFVDALSHDLRTPLTSTKLTAQLLMRMDREPSEVRVIAARINRNMDRADEMIRDLLDASRIKGGGKIPLRIRSDDMAAILHSALECIKDLYGDRFTVQAADPVKGWWDRRALTRILENLTANAVKYGDPSALITLSLRQDNDMVVITVHNVGNPIPEKEIPGLFDRFHRTVAADHGTERGWGIGLALVKGLSEAHGGSISAASTLESGTTFTVRLPLDARSA